MDVNKFDYELPDRLIAQKPAANRDESRLMVINRSGGIAAHTKFYKLLNYLQPGDRLVLNDSKVIPARLYGKKVSSGIEIEVLLLNKIKADHWEVLVRPGRRIKKGTQIEFAGSQGKAPLLATSLDYTDFGGRVLEFSPAGLLADRLDTLGEMPLPPYIKEYQGDPQRYQTVYANQEGSAAAPTAGLHFTRDLLAELKNNGIELSYLTLHVGLGTFRPVRTDKVEEHDMHAEYFEVSSETAQDIVETRKRGGRIIAVGTTVTRTLEGAADSILKGEAQKGWTDIFIYPGYDFKVLDGLITNFHLPKSTLLMLVSAFAGRENIMSAYQEAIEREYRFYSFGDATLII